MSVPNVEEESQTKISSLITQPQSWTPMSDSFPGTNIQSVSSVSLPDTKSSVSYATPPRLEVKIPSEGGRKDDQEKIRLELISSIALLQLGKVLTLGAVKYESHNWREGIAYSRIIGAILRHVIAYNNGESKDSETGLSHIAHAMCECMFLLELEVTHLELDDRYISGKK